MSPSSALSKSLVASWMLLFLSACSATAPKVTTALPGSGLSAAEQTVVGYLCSAIALYTYKIALQDRNLVEEIMVINNTRSENFKKNKEDFGDFGILTDTYGDLAEGDLSDAVAYLNANASDSVFPLWFNSTFYVNPTTPLQRSDYNNGGSRGSFFSM